MSISTEVQPEDIIYRTFTFHDKYGEWHFIINPYPSHEFISQYVIIGWSFEKMLIFIYSKTSITVTEDELSTPKKAHVFKEDYM